MRAMPLNVWNAAASDDLPPSTPHIGYLPRDVEEKLCAVLTLHLRLRQGREICREGGGRDFIRGSLSAQPCHPAADPVQSANALESVEAAASNDSQPLTPYPHPLIHHKASTPLSAWSAAASNVFQPLTPHTHLLTQYKAPYSDRSLKCSIQ